MLPRPEDWLLVRVCRRDGMAYIRASCPKCGRGGDKTVLAHIVEWLNDMADEEEFDARGAPLEWIDGHITQAQAYRRAVGALRLMVRQGG